MNRTKEPEAYKDFEPDTNVDDERGYALNLATRTLDALADSLMHGTKPHVNVPRLDPVFAAVTARALNLISQSIYPHPAQAKKTPAPSQNGESENKDQS